MVSAQASNEYEKPTEQQGLSISKYHSKRERRGRTRSLNVLMNDDQLS